MIKLKSLIKEYSFAIDPNINSKEWVRTKWPYDPEYAKKAPPIWAKKFGRGVVYLFDDPNFNYVSSFGADSDYSYSGSFYGMNVKDLEMAKNILDYKIPEELSHTRNELIQRHIKYMIDPSTIKGGTNV